MTSRRWIVAALLLVPAAFVVLPAAALAAERINPAEMTKTASGLLYKDQVVGSGRAPAAGQTCVMHYTGWIWRFGRKWRKFDSSVDKGTPFDFTIGNGEVIAGWDEGVSTMKVGGKRTLLIPPALGYGEKGVGRVIPGNATLLFEVELIDVR